MKALILVGGYGTRLRPLTLSVPKPLVQFCNRSIVEHQISALSKVGVKHVILAVAYKPEEMLDALKNMETKFNIKITCSHEKYPLGTGGPLKLAEEELVVDDDSEYFFMCNSDVICDFPFSDLLHYQMSIKSEGTILVTQVKDPSKYGVVVHDEHGKITQFVEKPKHFVGDWINAGIYLLKKDIISRISLKKTSIETEIFPLIAQEGKLSCMKLKGYWADIGKPEDFITGMQLYLESISNMQYLCGKDTSIPQIADGPHLIGNTIIDSSVTIGDGCLIGPNVTIDKNCTIGKGCRLKNTAVMQGVNIDDHTWISKSIIGWNSNIGKWVRIEGLTVIGEDVDISDECFINESFILPNKSISESIRVSGTIMM